MARYFPKTCQVVYLTSRIPPYCSEGYPFLVIPYYDSWKPTLSENHNQGEHKRILLTYFDFSYNNENWHKKFNSKALIFEVMTICLCEFFSAVSHPKNILLHPLRIFDLLACRQKSSYLARFPSRVCSITWWRPFTAASISRRLSPIEHSFTEAISSSINGILICDSHVVIRAASGTQASLTFPYLWKCAVCEASMGNPKNAKPTLFFFSSRVAPSFTTKRPFCLSKRFVLNFHAPWLRRYTWTTLTGYSVKDRGEKIGGVNGLYHVLEWKESNLAEIVLLTREVARVVSRAGSPSFSSSTLPPWGWSWSVYIDLWSLSSCTCTNTTTLR